MGKKEPTVHELRVALRPSKRKETLEVYQAFYEGKLIVEKSHEPALDACRYLLGKGVRGRLEVLGPDGDHRLTCDIEGAAKLSASGGGFGTWRPPNFEKRPSKARQRPKGLAARAAKAQPQKPALGAARKP